jgi:hypothetical protein
MTATTLPTPPPASHRRSRRPVRHRLRLRALVALLFFSGVLFVGVVCWHRDLARIKHTTDLLELVRVRLSAYYDERDHLPFVLQMPEKVRQMLGRPEIPYPEQHEIYGLTGRPGPYVVMSGSRKGLLPPREAGTAAIIYENGHLRTEWLTMDRIKKAREARADLLDRANRPPRGRGH